MSEKKSQQLKTVLGIDIGSLFLKMVAYDPRGKKSLEEIYVNHRGNPIKAIQEVIANNGKYQYQKIGVTGNGANLLCQQIEQEPIDACRALVRVIKEKFPNVRNIIDVGSGSITLIMLDQNGSFQNFSTNSLCAAGTGSFLDEQAGRLGLSYKDIKEVDCDCPPNIATRCSVFAKSDLIHRQQQGYSKQDLWSGLCKGMTSTMLQTLLNGKPLSGLTVVTGGVAQNKEVIKWLKKRYAQQITTFEGAHTASALGAAKLSSIGSLPDKNITVAWANLKETLVGRGSGEDNYSPLRLKKTKYPSFEVKENYVDEDDNEIRISYWPQEGEVQAYMGIDIGSTSTKILLMDDDKKVLLDIYRKTGGDPITATRKLFTSLSNLLKKKNTPFKILGCGTTGSGRKMIGSIIGADAVINEITAHVTGAMDVDPQIDTIFEIGGQDSKYMRTRDGNIYDSNMNYVCAAGTGSFVEEVGSKLGYKVWEVGPAVIDIAPPKTSDRCTVFMEQDVHKLIRRGYSKEECLAAVMYSVVQNYLNKVVGNRYYSRNKIFFQGATARNKGLVAAFENLLGVEMVVSPYCHVMGCYGVALLTREQMRSANIASVFKGLDLASRKIDLKKEVCEMCHNLCEITFAHIEDDDNVPSWGYLCGREPDDKKMKVSKHYNPILKRNKLFRSLERKKLGKNAPQVTMPSGLTTYSFFPLWRHFFAELGINLKMDKVTDEAAKQQGVSLVGAEFCFPIKAMHGHLARLCDQDEKNIFFPYMISNKNSRHTSNSYFCPYVISAPATIKSALELNGYNTDNFISPVFDHRMPKDKIIDELFDKIGQRFKFSRRKIAKALALGLKAQDHFEEKCRTEGEKILKELADRKEKAIVIIGRPYNIYDTGINLELPQKIADKGFTVIPLDFIPFESQWLGDEFNNMYWNYGQRIISAMKIIRDNPNLFGVYFTNFSCGPDSFILSYAEEVSGKKPFLTLELDEHGADTGYITRVEAFLDVVKNFDEPIKAPVIHIPDAKYNDFKNRKLWIPSMVNTGGRLFASAFRGAGYDCEALPDETTESFEIGRSVTRGSECLPTSVTIGALLSKFKQIDADPKKHAFFMATADGPCRFGQYSLLHRMILNRYGYQDVPILSPSSQNSYQGMDESLRRQMWLCVLFADIFNKICCRIRPYEVNKGETDRIAEYYLCEMEKCLSRGGNHQDQNQVMLRFMNAARNILREDVKKPLVGIVGEIYVRCNPFCNEEVIKSIERYGGEAWLAPMAEWFLYTAHMQSFAFKKGLVSKWTSWPSVLKNIFMTYSEHSWYKLFKEILADRMEPPIEEALKEGEKDIPIYFEGETILTVGRARMFIKEGANMVVNCAPFTCMPGTICTALFQKIQTETGVPIVNMFYDGEGDLNSRLSVFVNNLAH